MKRVGGERVINLTEDSPADDTMPVYSPEGNLVAFRSERDGGGIFIMGAMGESVRRLTDFGYLPSWSPDGKQIVMATEGAKIPGAHMIASQLWLIDVSTGDTQRITHENEKSPAWSPHGHRIAYVASGGAVDHGLWTISANGDQPVQVTDPTPPARDFNPVWSPDGRSLMFSRLDRERSSNLFRVPIDEETGLPRGEPVPITFGPEEIRLDITVSRDGSRIAYAELDQGLNLYKLDFDHAREEVLGNPIPLTKGSQVNDFVDCSPDGQWLAYWQLEKILISREDGSDVRTLHESPGRNRCPRWSPDGSKIIFSGDKEGKLRIWQINSDGSGLEQITTDQEGMNPHHYPFWSPDGSYVGYYYWGHGPVIFPFDAGAKDRAPPVVAPYDEEGAQFVVRSWSPDGKRLAGYRRQEDGKNAGIVIYDFETQDHERLTDFGRNPEWLTDNRRLIFVGETKEGIYLVDMETKRTKQIAPEGRYSCPLSPDNRSIYTHISTTEADIWLLTLNEERE